MEMRKVVYVLDKDGMPLMPETCPSHVHFLLKNRIAKPVCSHPFTIQQIHETEKGMFRPLHGAIRVGRTDIGVAVIDEAGEILYAAHVTSRNREIPRLVEERAEHRHASRRGERQRRKRRAKKNGTTTEFSEGHKLPGYEDDVLEFKDIRNTEAKFNNRKESALDPITRQCVQTHCSVVRLVEKILPVTDWTIVCEDSLIQQMKSGCIPSEKRKFRKHGHLKGIKTQIATQQKGRCALCGKPLACAHHILPAKEGGSDCQENLVGLCQSCHAKVHTNRILLVREGDKKKVNGAVVVKKALPYIYDRFCKLFGKEHVFLCSEAAVATFRKIHGIEETCAMDAACAAAIRNHVDCIIPDGVEIFEIRQFRNHNRAIIQAQTERTYKLDGEIVAKNRRPRFGQKGPALSDWFAETEQREGREAALKKLSQLKVKPSQRRYNDLKRPLPGTLFRYQGKIYVLQAQRTKGRYFIPVGYPDMSIPSKDCEIIGFRSLVYI